MILSLPPFLQPSQLPPSTNQNKFQRSGHSREVLHPLAPALRKEGRGEGSSPNLKRTAVQGSLDAALTQPTEDPPTPTNPRSNPKSKCALRASLANVANHSPNHYFTGTSTGWPTSRVWSTWPPNRWPPNARSAVKQPPAQRPLLNVFILPPLSFILNLMASRANPSTNT